MLFIVLCLFIELIQLFGCVFMFEISVHSFKYSFIKLTFARAEAEFLVSAVVGRGGAPWQVVLAAVSGAGGVGFALEGEGEVAHGSIRVPKASLHS